jgi:acylphosphatase
MTNKRMIITGDNVQDVVYRLFLLDNAERTLITHLDARNLKERSDQEIIEKVEVLIGGNEHRVNKFVDFIKNNFPVYANVDIPVGDAEDYDGDIRTIKSFSRCLSVHQLVKFANIGTDIVVGVKGLRTDVGGLRTDVGGLRTDVGGLRTDTNNNFGKMDKKFEVISRNMFDIVKEMKETNRLFDKRMEKLEERCETTSTRTDERNQIVDTRIEKMGKHIEVLLEFLVEQKNKEVIKV